MLGLCASLSTSAPIFAKDIISFIARSEMLGGGDSESEGSVVPMIGDKALNPAPWLAVLGAHKCSGQGDVFMCCVASGGGSAGCF